MKIKALRTVRGDYGLLLRGHEEDIDDPTAKKLVAAGYAEEVPAKDSKITESRPDAPPVTPRTSDHAPSEAPKKKAKPHAVDKDS